MLTGRCLCGAVRYRIASAPRVMYYCHCAQCRRASGSSFATNVVVPAADFAFTAGEELVAQYESSPGKQRRFCSRCGSPLYSRSQASAQILSVRCGTLEGDPGIRPSAHIHVSSKSPWYEIRDGLAQKPGDLAG